ncbi:hypothetical protein BaRGS_00004430 [Batillaria attramentaria]|uniref:Uncharacterized protein n=1 Tax=Batillaria attramentaria TaxID=370345 RepID=A0ABD0LY44_9CAEN
MEDGDSISRYLKREDHLPRYAPLDTKNAGCRCPPVIVSYITLDTAPEIGRYGETVHVASRRRHHHGSLLAGFSISPDRTAAIRRWQLSPSSDCQKLFTSVPNVNVARLAIKRLQTFYGKSG